MSCQTEYSLLLVRLQIWFTTQTLALVRLFGHKWSKKRTDASVSQINGGLSLNIPWNMVSDPHGTRLRILCARIASRAA